MAESVTFPVARRGFLAGAALLALDRSEAAESELDRRIRSRMQRFLAAGELPGVVTLVGSREEVLSLVALGNRDLEGRPMRANTPFRIASMTKPITSVAVMQLADAGRLSVEDPVEKHLPEFRGQMLIESRERDRIVLVRPPRPITLRDLLTHTSGLPGAPPPGMADLYQKRDRTLAEAVYAFSQRPLEFPPGSRWAYCNAGIDTLGRVVEVVSGAPFETYLDVHLFRPLGMKDTTFFPTRELAGREAAILNRRDGRLVPEEGAVVGSGAGARYPIPAGGLVSTAPDLARFYRAMLRGGALGEVRILSEASVRTMTALQTGNLTTGFVPGMGFGFGWAVVRAPEGVTAMLSPGTYGHGGAFGTQGWLDPLRGRFAILMIARTGLANGDASEMRRELQAEAWGA
ncbi:MAG: beta-lactamase family protein [Armatimonadetes bacterium]|nr:beta-lactamase family protein [Armatimonadota bacterium]